MKKVLVVDDSMLARKMLVRSLPKDWDVEVAQLSGGAEAVSTCRTSSPTVMFLDLNMPEMDGYQVLQALEGSDLPTVIVVSADIQPLARQRVLALGAKAIVKKPATADAIEAALRGSGVL